MPSTCQQASPRGRHRHPSGRLFGALLAAGLILATPALQAAKGGEKGKPGGGGGEDPPPPPLLGEAVELGFKDYGTPEQTEVVWIAGVGVYRDAVGEENWDATFAYRLELDLTTGAFDLVSLNDFVADATDGYGDPVNAIGEVAGTIEVLNADTGGWGDAYFWDADGVASMIGHLPGATRTIPRDMNARGEVVGSSGVAPFLWNVESQTITDLNSLTGGGLGLEHAGWINEAGQITSGRTEESGNAYYLLTPISAP